MFLLQLLRFLYRVLSVICPVCAGKLAFWQFQRPGLKKTRERELKLFDEFREIRIPFEEEDLFVYECGPAKAYPVILVHGWESNPGSMYGVASVLAKSGFRVMVLGFPAHGRSTLKKTNMVHSSGAIHALLAHYGLKDRFSMVTHSFGSGASAIALSGKPISADKLVFITSSEVIRDIFDDYAKVIGLGKKAYDYLLQITERITPVPVKDFIISGFLKNVTYSQLTIIHDEDDKVIPYANATAIGSIAPNAKVIPVRGKGHYRILWDEEIYGMILEELKPLKGEDWM